MLILASFLGNSVSHAFHFKAQLNIRLK
ncbi:hypothetical protein B14911_06718 [Bacillus sp. NRRL B-14911]|nr:hypothetical protein B14911_06718 [Bacillus sp. NRRL B-14911]